MSQGVGLVLLAAGSFASVLLLVPLTRNVAIAYGVVSTPQATRLHTYPVPCLGGVAIALTALGGSVFLPEWSVQAAAILLGGCLVAAVGLVDDVRSLSPGPRLLAEAVAAAIAATAGARLHLFGGPLDWVVAIVWLVVVTNSFNLLDNMDGAAGTIASAISLALIVAAALGGQHLVGGLAALIFGSSLGFLVFNWHPAKVFMGDAGALFLGFLTAAAALKLRFPVGKGASAAALLLLAGPAVFDTTLVVMARVRSGRPIYLGATDHVSHRLLRLGLRTRTVAFILAGASLVSAGLGILVGRDVVAPAIVLPALLAPTALALVWLLRLPDGVPGVEGPAAAKPRLQIAS